MVAELDSLVEYYKTDAESNKGELDSEYARAQQSFYNDAKLRLEKGLALLNAWSRSQVEGPEARWVLLRGIELRSQLDEADPELWFSPASAAEGLDTQLWKRCAGAVLCSATLAIGRRFDRCYDALGWMPGRLATLSRARLTTLNKANCCAGLRVRSDRFRSTRPSDHRTP